MKIKYDNRSPWQPHRKFPVFSRIFIYVAMETYHYDLKKYFSSWQPVKMLSRIPNYHFWVEWLLVLKNASGCNVFRNFALTRYVSWQSQSACLDDTKQLITTLKKHNNLSTDLCCVELSWVYKYERFLTNISIYLSPFTYNFIHIVF